MSSGATSSVTSMREARPTRARRAKAVASRPPLITVITSRHHHISACPAMATRELHDHEGFASYLMQILRDHGLIIGLSCPNDERTG